MLNFSCSVIIYFFGYIFDLDRNLSIGAEAHITRLADPKPRLLLQNIQVRLMNTVAVCPQPQAVTAMEPDSNG